VFLTGDRPGFDVILCNPPYDVLSEKETGRNVDHLREFVSVEQEYDPATIGKSNLYKLFVVRCAHLLAEGGQVAFIVPMSLLGDEQTSGIRAMLFDLGDFREIHAFPQKDSVARRVFPDAKLSTTLFIFRRGLASRSAATPFPSYVHPGRFIEQDAAPLLLSGLAVRSYDSKNLTIVSCTQHDWDVVTSLDLHRIHRLGEYAEFFQGEVNQTVATGKGLLVGPEKGVLVTRGAGISMYQLRPASQGEDLFLNVAAFLEGADQDAKAYHHRLERVAVQETSPQNNFRRIIACRIPSGHFCNHKINYTTAKHCKFDLGLMLFVLNSAFADWYFRLGSTNAAVSHYQLQRIPCPAFELAGSMPDYRAVGDFERLLHAEQFDSAEHDLLSRTHTGEVDATLAAMIARAVRFIEDQEASRGNITRTERSSLSEKAAPAQRMLDRALIVLLGLDVSTYDYIEGRLAKML
jgi:hypothetical protein